MTLPTYSYRMTRLHCAMSMPSSATEVAIRIFLSPLARNASSTHFCAGRVIPVPEAEGITTHQRGNFTLEDKQPLTMECLLHARDCDKCFVFMISQQPQAVGPILSSLERAHVGWCNLDSATTLPEFKFQRRHLPAVWL